MIKDTHNIQTILLTTDLSTDAASAYGMAASLMYAYTSHLTLLTCIDTSPQYSEASLGALEAPSLISPQTLTEAYGDVERMLQECITTHFDPTRTTYKIVQAPTAVQHSIVTCISEMTPDLVIMSSHGRSGISRALLGSVTEYVLRHCKCPVLVVPAKPR